MRKGYVTLAASRMNLERLHRLVAQHLLDTGDKLTVVQMLDEVINSYCASVTSIVVRVEVP